MNIVYNQGHGRAAVKSFTCAPLESFTYAMLVGVLPLGFHSFPLKHLLKAGVLGRAAAEDSSPICPPNKYRSRNGEMWIFLGES